MFNAILEFVFIHGWLHVVLLILSVLGILYWKMQIILNMRSEPPFNWERPILGMCASCVIFVCLLIPPMLPDPGRAALGAIYCLAILAMAIIVEKIISAVRAAIWWKKEEEKIETFKEELLLRRIPEIYPELPFLHSQQEINRISSPCHVAYNWVRELKPLLDGKKCLEVSCRLGMLSRAMQDVGIDIIATEKKDYSSGRNPDWCEIERLSAVDAVRKYGKETDYIVCTFPEYGDPDIGNALKEINRINPGCKLVMAGCKCSGVYGCGDITGGNTWNECIERANERRDWTAAQIFLIDIGKLLGPKSE